MAKRKLSTKVALSPKKVVYKAACDDHKNEAKSEEKNNADAADAEYAQNKLKRKKLTKLSTKNIASKDGSDSDSNGGSSLAEDDNSSVDAESSGDDSSHGESQHRNAKDSHSTNKKTDKSGNAKPDWKTFKTEKKKLKETRKKTACSFYEICKKAKTVCESLKRNDCSKKEKDELLVQLHNMLKGSYAQIVYTHDMARIVQLVIKNGNEKVQDELVTELQRAIVSMGQQKYSCFCVSKMLEYGSDKMKKTVLDCFIGNSVKLLCHNIASKIVCTAYSKHASPVQKCFMRQDFYGEIFKLSRSEKVKCLADAFETSQTMKDAILSSAKANVSKVISKGHVDSELLHTVLHDVLSHSAPGPDIEEVLVPLRSMLPALPTTKHGALIGMQCLWSAGSKERKNMMKACKDYIQQLACHEHGHLVLLAMIDCVDDTVLLGKVILSPILDKAHEVASNEYGRKVILYLVAHRDTQFFHPTTIDVLKQGDTNPHSKKPMATRRADVIGFVSQPLLQQLTDSPLQWITSYAMCMVTLGILKNCKGDKLDGAFKALSQLLVDEKCKVSENGTEESVVENKSVHMMLRRLIDCDKLKYQEDNNSVLLSLVLAQSLQPKTVWWLKFNRGAFLLVFLLESNIPEVVEAIKKFLKPIIQQVMKTETPGAKILLKKL